MPTLLIKNVSEELLSELRRLKKELECKTWSELLEKLVKYRQRGVFFISNKELREIEKGKDGFLKLREVVSKKWVGEPGVLEEFRKSRKHV
ncbi:MAG: hypothetical protein ACTSXW_07155 [Candidatus Baldrarchaeia archaeon]